MVLKKSIQEYKREIAGAGSLPSSLWYWNMGISFRWGKKGNYFISGGARSTGRSNDHWPDLAPINALFAESGDAIILEEDQLDGADPEICQYWRELGLCPRDITFIRAGKPSINGGPDWSRAISPTPQFKLDHREDARLLICFGNGTSEKNLARKEGLRLFGAEPEAAERCNNKAIVKTWCRELGIPSPEGEVCHSRRQVVETAARLLQEHEQIILKEPFGASGKGMVLCRSLRTAERVAETAFESTSGAFETGQAVIVEAWCEKSKSHNSQYLILPSGRILFLGATEQILNRQKYIGNLFHPDWRKPVEWQLLKAQMHMAEMAYAQGYRGVLGIDSVHAAGGDLYPVIELNARFNMSTYGFEVLDALNHQGAACLRSFSVKWERNTGLEDFVRESSLPSLYRRGNSAGMIPLGFTGRSSPEEIGLLRMNLLFLGECAEDASRLAAGAGQSMGPASFAGKKSEEE